MKLNRECVRDLMLYLEESLDDKNFIDVLGIKLSDYSEDEIVYTAKKLIEAQYLNGKAQYASNKIYRFPIASITFSGHNFLDNIRPQGTWDMVNEKTKSIGSVSIEIISSIAAQIGTLLLSKALGL